MQKVKPFDSGTQYVEWVARNCNRCKYGFTESDWYQCEIQYALDLAFITDGHVDRYIAEAMGWKDQVPWYYTWDCPLKEAVDGKTNPRHS